MLKEFKKRKAEIFQAYDKLVQEGIAKKEEVERWKSELDREEFTVSFCGQIKAGKSTLLNALIFRKPVLPSKITPHTAKLTLIKYGEKLKFKVNFYSQKEWKELQKVEKDGEKYFDKYLKEEVNKRITKGIYPDSVLGTSKEIRELKELNKFVGADGEYTPFVKEITIYYPNPILKELTIVDTPGTNDPNPLRSEETKKWIKNSNAVVYVVYAGQAFSEPDIEFINEYLLTVPPNLMVFAVNKIDTVTSIEEVKAWVESVKNDERLKVRGIMQDKESIAFVSALAGLIERMLKDCEKAGIEPDECIPEEFQEHAEELYEKEFLDEEKHGIPELERVIEKKLIKTKGHYLLCTHKQRIIGLIDRKSLEVEKNLKAKSEQLKALGQSREEIERKIEELEQARKKLKKSIKILNDKAFENINRFRKYVDKIVNEEIRQGRRNIERIAKELESVDWDAIPGEAAFRIKATVNEMFSRIKSKLSDKNKEAQEFKQNMNIAYEEFKKNAKGLGVDVSDTFDFFPFNTIFAESMAEVEEELAEQEKELYYELEELKKECSNLAKSFIRFLTFGLVDGGNRKKFIAKIKNRSLIFIEKSLRGLPNIIKRAFRDAISQKFEEVGMVIANRIETVSKALGMLLEEEESVEKASARLKEEVAKVEKELQHLQEVKKQLSNLIKVECGHV
ncbi:dynamin family protein [Thermovibrio ammonificans HB-1]|uniref:Dynamin family protein n=1 Tax=Thermovibrio ammonificans (strain DSM 15698 / JCM 12110 / HB-1) TaxID=648996 RepID=E8T1Z8_THEA1|nr:dynamin family protein [Thermovibrio ammonificans]ADU96893.1 dynamin family protein [Thermovibrio ammonificans HB-1]